MQDHDVLLELNTFQVGRHLGWTRPPQFAHAGKASLPIFKVPPIHCFGPILTLFWSDLALLFIVQVSKSTSSYIYGAHHPCELCSCDHKLEPGYEHGIHQGSRGLRLQGSRQLSDSLLWGKENPLPCVFSQEGTTDRELCSRPIRCMSPQLGIYPKPQFIPAHL